MINKIHFIKYLAVMLFSLGLSAQQVSVTPTNVEYTNSGQSTVFIGCGNFNLASSASTIIKMRINISTYSSVINNSQSDLYFYTKKSFSATEIERHHQTIPPQNWIAGSGSTATIRTFQTTITFSINAADFNTTGGTLYAVFVSPSGTRYASSCTFTITKNPSPSFTLAPTTVSLACGDTAAKTFTVTPANIPPGVTPSYSWSAPGWTQVGTTTNSRTFQPSSGSILPEEISVTPSINNVAQTTLRCTVTRAPFTSNAAISGANAICAVGASAIYTINAGSGNIVVWSSSNTSIATLSSATNSQVTVTRQAAGDFILNATITNLCNQTVNIPPRIIAGGVPQITGFICPNDSTICSGTICRQELGLPSFSFSNNVEANSVGLTPVQIIDKTNWEWERINTNIVIAQDTQGNQIYIAPNFVGQTGVRVRAKNDCGWSDWSELYFEIVDCGIGLSRLSAQDKVFIVYPNPSNEDVNIDVKEGNTITVNSKVSAELFDIMGNSKARIKIKNNKATFNVSALNKGIYVLHINIDGKVEGHQVIVE